MPMPAGVLRADRLAVDQHIRNDINFWVAKLVELAADIDLQRTETTRERDVLLGGQILITKANDRKAVQGD
jgi:hypothetical protein